MTGYQFSREHETHDHGGFTLEIPLQTCSCQAMIYYNVYLWMNRNLHERIPNVVSINIHVMGSKEIPA